MEVIFGPFLYICVKVKQEIIIFAKIIQLQRHLTSNQHLKSVIPTIFYKNRLKKSHPVDAQWVQHKFVRKLREDTLKRQFRMRILRK